MLSPERIVRKAMTMFKQFEIVRDFSDNYYAESSRKTVEKFNKSFAGKRLQMELKKLETDVPESIYIRAYEGRQNLLRAAIVGAAGTPYHDNLFFFDLWFSDMYPFVVPKIHYHSFGYKINPIFHKNGEVRIKDKMLWFVIPLLLSIQALLLTAKPYFNNPVYRQWAGTKYWEKIASAHNEEVFLNSCKTMMHLLAKPPMHFRELVRSHFRCYGGTILLACRAYMDGYSKVGALGRTYAPDFSSLQTTASKKFKSSVAILYPKLLAAFIENESSLKDSIIGKETPLHNLRGTNTVEREVEVSNSTRCSCYRYFSNQIFCPFY